MVDMAEEVVIANVQNDTFPEELRASNPKQERKFRLFEILHEYT